MRKPYVSLIKICTLVLLFVVYRDYLPGEPSPFMSVNLEMPSKSSAAREFGRLIFPVLWAGSVASILLSPFLSVSILRISFTSIFLLSWLFNTSILHVGQAGDSSDIPKEN